MSWSIPVKTEFMKTQMGHAPSMQYAKDIYKVASTMPKDFTALEIGMAWGFSTLAILASGAKHLSSVDPNTSAEGLNESKANGYTNHVWTCCRSDKFWEENQTVSFGLIYVDGSHLYEDVKNDLYEAWKRLNKDGLLMVDDWDHVNNIKNDPSNHKNQYGVSLACWEFFRDNTCKIGVEGRVLWFRK